MYNHRNILLLHPQFNKINNLILIKNEKNNFCINGDACIGCYYYN